MRYDLNTLWGHRSITYRTYIFIFGGLIDLSEYKKEVYGIDTVNNEFFIAGSLNHAAWNAPVIIQYPTIHIFGGWDTCNMPIL